MCWLKFFYSSINNYNFSWCRALTQIYSHSIYKHSHKLPRANERKIQCMQRICTVLQYTCDSKITQKVKNKKNKKNNYTNMQLTNQTNKQAICEPTDHPTDKCINPFNQSTGQPNTLTSIAT